jgi:cyclopropane fatty-acyl-phospholipid synthase-like methyltransferase
VKPATDPGTDYKALVRQGYEQCSARFTAARQNDAPVELRLVTDRLDPGASVLDLGCGGGVPVARALAERFRVTGVDFSAEQVRRARANVPTGTFHCCDVMDYQPEPAAFAAVTAFYLFFHLPREEQLELARRIHAWLRPGGLLLATVGLFDEAPYTEDDFFGVPMFWTNFSRAGYETAFREVGFQLLETLETGHGYAGAARAERHPLLLAERLA